VTVVDVSNVQRLLRDGWRPERLGVCPYCGTDIVWRSNVEFAQHVLSCALIDQGVRREAALREPVKTPTAKELEKLTRNVREGREKKTT